MAFQFTPGCGCCGGCRVGLQQVHNCCAERLDCDAVDYADGEACVLGVWNSLRVEMGFFCGAVSESLNTCLQWSSGRTFTGTGVAGDAWSVTLGESVCDDTTITIIESASVTLDGITVTWTRTDNCAGASNNGDLPISYGCYEVTVSPNDDCPDWCPTFDATLYAWPRNWEEIGDAPPSIAVTFSGFSGGSPAEISTCCTNLNATHTLSVFYGSTANCPVSLEDGGAFGFRSTNVVPTDGCWTYVELQISSTNESPCSIAIELRATAVYFETGVQIYTCTRTWRRYVCLSPTHTFDLSGLNDWVCGSEGCCDGTVSVSGTIPT